MLFIFRLVKTTCFLILILLFKLFDELVNQVFYDPDSNLFVCFYFIEI